MLFCQVGDGGVLARRKWKHPNDAVQPATFTASKTGVAGHNPHQGQSDEEKSGLTSERSEEPAGEASSSEIHAYRRRSVGSDADDGDVVRPLPNLVSSNQLPPIVPRIPLAGNLPGLLPSERTTERAAASNGTRRTARSVLVEIPPRRIQESGGPVAESGEASLNGAHADSASLVWLSRQSPAALAVLKAVDSGYRGQRQNDRGRRAEALLPPYLDSPRPVCEAFPSDSDKCGGQMTDLTAASDSAALLADHNHQPQEEPGTFCCRGGARWNEKLNFVADSMEFQGLIAAIIMANAMTLSLVHYPMAESFSNVLEVCNYVFLSAFAAEAALKIVGLGPRAYFLDAFNVFDFAVILVSLAELAVDNAVSAVDIPGLTVLRALRLLRILKLLKHWSSLSSLAIVVLQGLSNLTSFMVILFIFVFTFALIGMEASQAFLAEYSPPMAAEFLRLTPLSLASDFQWAHVRCGGLHRSCCQQPWGVFWQVHKPKWPGGAALLGVLAVQGRTGQLQLRQRLAGVPVHLPGPPCSSGAFEIYLRSCHPCRPDRPD